MIQGYLQNSMNLNYGHHDIYFFPEKDKRDMVNAIETVLQISNNVAIIASESFRCTLNNCSNYELL